MIKMKIPFRNVVLLTTVRSKNVHLKCKFQFCHILIKFPRFLTLNCWLIDLLKFFSSNCGRFRFNIFFLDKNLRLRIIIYDYRIQVF